MNGTHDTNQTAAADNGGEFDPREAATLFEQAQQQARVRGAFARPIAVWAVAGVGVFVVLLGRAAATAWLHRS
jgi:hypothetical protein